MSTQRATCWSLTINNPNNSDEEFIALARQKGWKVDGQLEKGAEGTPHYQLILRTPQVRFSQVKKAFPRAHIEIARNPAALAAYTQKSETALAPLLASSSKYPSLSMFWDLIFGEDPFPESCASNGALGQQRRLDYLDERTRDLIRRGYHVETMAINPQTRSAFAKFAFELHARVLEDRQTRQTVQEVVVPTTYNQDGVEEEEDDGSSSEGSSEGSWASDESPF